MRAKRKPEPAEQLPELCAAVRAVRLAYGESQEIFARRVELATMTISRFERGKQIPTDYGVLMRLTRTARNKELIKETELFEQAALRVRGPREVDLGLACVPVHSLRQWRLMHAAAVAFSNYPEIALAMEQAAGPALALVDQAIRDYTNRSGGASGLGAFRTLPEILLGLAERQAFESFKEKKENE